MREIVRAEAWKGFREFVEELGGAPSEILAAANVDEGALAYPDRYLPLRSLVNSIEIAAQRLERRDFGLLLGARANVNLLGALTIAASNSPSGREGFEIIARYVHIHNPAITVEITPIANTAWDLVNVDAQCRSTENADQYVERSVSMVHAALRALCGPGYRPIEVRFRNQRISPLDVYRRMFGVTPKFGENALGIVVARATLDSYQPGRNTDLRAITESYLRSLGTPRTTAFLLRVTNLVRGLLSTGECTPDQVARALGIHERTMQRRLSNESASFEQIKDDVRKEMAAKLLAQPNVPISHIAYVLNYADSSAFTRSARRWFGMAPRTYRARLLATPQPDPRTLPRSRIKAWEASILAREDSSAAHHGVGSRRSRA